MPFSGSTFTHLFDWEKDPQRQEKIINSRLEAEFDGIDTALSSLSAGGRELLTAARTYYVRTDGSDSNDGLTDSAAGAFLTVQKAVDVIASTIDAGGQTITVQVKDGTYTGTVTLKNVVGFGAAGTLIIQGNSGTPANVVISTTSNPCFKADGITTIWDIKDMKLQTTTSGNCLQGDNGSIVRFANVNFGACAQSHLLARFGGAVVRASTGSFSYAISAGATTAHMSAASRGLILTQGATATLSNTPAFTTFADCTQGSHIAAALMTFAGTGATGKRYNSTGNSNINTNGGGANYFPGNAAGTTTADEEYV